MTRALKLLLSPVWIVAWLSGCDAPPDNVRVAPQSVQAALDCGQIVVAHRGTSEDWPEPENSLAALNRLAAGGIPMAEIDVAQTRDGVHFLYHDGVWEEMSTCSGAVAASVWSEAQDCLLKTRAGELSASTPPRLETYLARAAETGILLEIDFKSSADYETVIDAVRKAGLGERVILIAYTDGQADRLSRLAPDMWVSVPRDYAEFDPARHLRWFGGDSPPTSGRQAQGYSVGFHERADVRVSDAAGELRVEGCGG